MRERDGEGARQRGRERDADVTAVTVKSGEQLFPFAGTRAWLSFSRATREPFHWPGDHPPTPPPPPPTDAGPPSRRRRPIKHVLPRSPNARRTQPPNEFDYNFSSGFPPLKPPPPPPPIASPLGCVSTCAPDPKIDIRVYKATRITAPWCTRLHPVGGGGGVGLGERRTGTRRWPREMEQLVNGWGADDRIGRHRTRL